MKRQELASEWTRWLSHVFSEAQQLKLISLTFAPTSYEVVRGLAPSRSRALRAATAFEKALLTTLERPSFFAVIERGALAGRLHIHALVDGAPAALKIALASHRETSGYVDVKDVSQIGGVSAYVTKYVTKQADADWWASGPLFDIAKELPDGAS